MKLTLYYNASDTNVLGKQLNYILELTGFLRQTTDIINPIIDIEVESNGSIKYEDNVCYEDDIELEASDGVLDFDIGVKFNTNIFKCNYVYIHEFERYYFINDIVIKGTNIYSIVCNIDVLETYKDYILNLDALVSRNQNNYSDLIEDNLASYYYNKTVEYHYDDYKISGDFSFDTSLTSWCYVWTKFSSSDTSDKLSLLGVDDVQTGNTKNTEIYVLQSDSDVASLSKAIVSSSALLTYVKHLMAYPFQPTRGSTKHLAYIINAGLNAVEIWCADTLYNTQYIDLGVYRIPIGNDYMAYSPYTKYEVWIPYYGWVELSAETLMDDRFPGSFRVEYIVNFATAEAQVFIKKYVNNECIFSAPVTLGVEIPLDSTNRFENDKRKEALRNSTAISLLGSIISTGMGYATSNPMMMAGGVMSGVKALAEAQASYNQMYEQARVDMTKAEMSVFNRQRVIFKITKVNKINENIAEYFGKPLNQKLKLNTLSGYTQVKEIHLDNFTGNNQEIDMLYTILKNGFIIS